MGSGEILSGFTLLILGLAVFVRPWLGVALLVLVGALGRFARIPLFDLDLVEIAGGLTVWAGVVFLLFNRKKMVLSPPDLAVALLALAVLMSVLNASELDLALAGVKFFALLCLYFISVQVLNTKERIGWLLLTIVLVCGTLSAVCIGLYFLNIPVLSVGGIQARLYYGSGAAMRMAGPFEQPNIWAQITIIAVPVGLCLAVAEKGVRRWLLGGLTALTLVNTVLTQSRSAIFAMALGITCVLFLILRRMRPTLIGATLLIVAAAGTSSLQDSALLARYSEQPLQQEFRVERRKSRAQVFLTSIKVFLANPLGVGFGGDDRTVGVELGMAAMSPHNALLRLAVNTGFLGLIAGVWLMVSQLRSLWRLARDQVTTESGLLAAGVLGAVVAIWIHNMFHAFLHLTFVWIFFSVASAMVLLRPNVVLAQPRAASPSLLRHARIVLPT